MTPEIKEFIKIFVLGCSLIAYAHARFATKDEVQTNRQFLIRIDSRVDSLYNHFIGE